jgi:uncharacterized protein (TIGR03084 family)
MAVDLASVVNELAVEEDDLANVVGGLTTEDWHRPTPAVGWTIRDQVAHLAEGEELAALALDDELAFADRLRELLVDLDRARASMEAKAFTTSGPEALAAWESGRRDTITSLRRRSADDRIPWITGRMSSVSFATARLMETWAHGQDIWDALGRDREPTGRLRHIAHLGVATHGFSFTNRGLDAPPAPTVVLTAPDGDEWRWEPAGAVDQVRGPALDFCLVVTQRRHHLDTALVADGDGALRWLEIAQAFAGPPTDGPAPRR